MSSCISRVLQMSTCFSPMRGFSGHLLQNIPTFVLKSTRILATAGNINGIRISTPNQRNGRLGGFCTRSGSPDTAAISSSPACLSVAVRCPRHEIDVLSEALLCFGASSASMDELDELESDEEACITSIFSADQDVSRCVSLAAESIGMRKTPKFDVIVTKDYDWVQNVKETFHPIEVTDGLWIVPEWRTPVEDQALNIFLNPGMAFGTGEHPTTKLCLLLLKGLIKGGERVLDYGTGSGILGISAIKMGAALSVGVDIEPQAVTSARQNIALNSITPERMPLYLSPIEDRSNSLRSSFDIIVANILLNPLMELAEELVSFGKSGTLVGLSGILLDQVPDVEETYSKYLENISISEMDGWACVSDHPRLMIRHVVAASQKVTHPGTVPDQARLTTEFQLIDL